MKTKPILSTFVLLCLSACASVPQEPLRAEIQGKSNKQVAERVASLCQDYGLNVDDVKSNSVQCSKVAGFTSQLFYKTKYGSDVEAKIKFLLLSPKPDMVRVTPQAWAERMNTFGGVKKYPVQPQGEELIRLIFQDLERY